MKVRQPRCILLAPTRLLGLPELTEPRKSDGRAGHHHGVRLSEPLATRVQTASGRGVTTRARGDVPVWSLVSTIVARRSHRVAPWGGSMATKITRDIVEAYLNCKYKAHLKLAGQFGTPSDYGQLMTASREEVRHLAIDKILARHPTEADQLARNVVLTLPALKRGATFFLNATLEDDHIALAFDGLRRVPGPSKLGDFHYVPMLFCEGRQIRKEQRALLEVYGLLLSRLQGRMPGFGLLWHGKECRAARVRLSPDPRKPGRILDELRLLKGERATPRLLLNDHGAVGEFRQRVPPA